MAVIHPAGFILPSISNAGYNIITWDEGVERRGWWHALDTATNILTAGIGISATPVGQAAGERVRSGVGSVGNRLSNWWKKFRHRPKPIAHTTLTDWAGKTDQLARTAPIEIPSNATVTQQIKNGYEQIRFKWSTSTHTYEVRWHTRTPGAPASQGNTWVVSRITPGTPAGQLRVEHILAGDRWVPRFEWQAAITANQNGTATAAQKLLLEAGHWTAP